MTSLLHEKDDAFEGVEAQAKERRSAQDARDRDTNRMIKVQLVGALWGICLLAPTLLFPAGWIRYTWIVVAVLVTRAVVIRVYLQESKK
ncbi:MULTISPECIES: hypothetical protein [unclassified Frondihabitans]|uniref:hypothetical protein n=1 Tax=unclassified Frondihabitans TaxID=2626248 RepID=UPI000F50469E|nr:MULTISPECIES: hypothetical protein [unclassified Frondihabitans]RPE78113.1 hypothetical protein EDF37_0783 [Frondihabitans sp. PhB153]RPF08394.1 hypothetical protein EDF39_0785 [Frondihabitans sp. PhB161]